MLNKVHANILILASFEFLKSSCIAVPLHPSQCWSISFSNELLSVTQEVRSKLVFCLIFLLFFPQVFQSQITALQDEMEEKGQEMDKMRQELKDKEVESRIAGKKGDQLVRICVFDCFSFRFCSCAFGILSLLLTNFSIYNRNVHRKIVAMLCKGGRDITGWGVMEREVVRLLPDLWDILHRHQLSYHLCLYFNCRLKI